MIALRGRQIKEAGPAIICPELAETAAAYSLGEGVQLVCQLVVLLFAGEASLPTTRDNLRHSNLQRDKMRAAGTRCLST